MCRCVIRIDPATGWFEIHQYDDKKSITVALIRKQKWFQTGDTAQTETVTSCEQKSQYMCMLFI
jgi:hypothetical protein